MVVVLEFCHSSVTSLVSEGRERRALQLVDAGLDAARSEGLRSELLACLVDKARLQRALGDRDAARATMSEADEVAPLVVDVPLVVCALRVWAELTSPSWSAVERLLTGLDPGAAGADFALAVWSVADKASAMVAEGSLAAAATLYAALVAAPCPESVSGVPLVPEAGLAATLRALGYLGAAAASVYEAEASYVERKDPLVARCLLMVERRRLLAAAGRHEAAADVHAALRVQAPAAMQRLEARVLELARAAAGRPNSYLLTGMRQWETIARSLGDHTTIVRCWLPAETALTRLGPSGDEWVRQKALSMSAEAALLAGLDRFLRRLHALLACVGIRRLRVEG